MFTSDRPEKKTENINSVTVPWILTEIIHSFHVEIHRSQTNHWKQNNQNIDGRQQRHHHYQQTICNIMENYRPQLLTYFIYEYDKGI